MDTVITPTREDVEKLKREWKHDPCWDLEITTGYEAYHDELLAFSKKCQDEWTNEYIEQRKKEAVDMGVEYDSPLFHYLSRLDNRIKQLEKLVFKDE